MFNRLLLLLLFVTPFIHYSNISAQSPIPVNPEYTSDLTVTAVLSGDQAIPLADNNIKAIAAFTVNEKREDIKVKVYANNESGDLTQVVVREGSPGSVGPIVLSLTDDIEGKKINTTLTDVDEQVVTDLLLGKYYIEIKTFNFPGLAARGELRIESAHSFHGEVTSANILNDASDSPAKGIISTHYTPDIQNLEINFFASDLSDAITGAFLYIGDESTVGGTMAMDLSSFAIDNRIFANVDPSSFVEHLSNSNVYIKIYTENYPDGEIRGQLNYDPNLVHDGWLAGAQVLPSPTTLGINGFSLLSLAPDFLNVDYWVYTDDLGEDIFKIKLHNSDVGTIGGVIHILPLEPGSKTAIGSIETGPFFSGRLLSGGIYVNVQTLSNIDGIVRGQLYRVARQSKFYDFCPTVQGDADGGGMFSYNRKLTYAHVLATGHNLSSDLTSVSLNEGTINNLGPVIGEFTNTVSDYVVDAIWDENSSMPFNSGIVESVLAENTYMQFSTVDNPEGEIRGKTSDEDCPEITDEMEDSADLELELDLSRAHYVQYDSLGLCFTVTNTGTLTADDIVVDIPLPDGFVYCYDFTTQGEYDLYYQTWNVGTLAPGESAKLSLWTLAMVGGINVDYFAQIVNSSEYDQDSTPGNNQNNEDDEVSTTILALENGGSGTGNFDVDLELSMVADQMEVAPYENVNYTITVSNQGSDIAHHVMMNVTLPAGLAYTSHASSKGKVSLYNGQWYILELAPGETATLDLELFTLWPSSTISFFTQIHAVDEPDVDSTPGNVFDFVVTEDDEARVDITTTSAMPEGNTSFNFSQTYAHDVYPNPTRDAINFSVQSDKEADGQLHIYNGTGQIVLTQNLDIQKGFNKYTFDAANFPVGTYFIHVTELEIISRFIKM